MKKAKLKKLVAPTWRRTLSEARWVAELARYLAYSGKAVAADSPPGDRRPILVIPGFLCSDLSTWPLRRFLRRIGYRSFSWKQGVNWGPRAGVRVRLLRRLQELRARCGEPVTIIGWSLGGIYARELACVRPDLVREVITLGSPVQGRPEMTAVWGMFRWLNRRHLTPWEMASFEFPHPADTPCLSIFTEQDGIVPWQLCVPQRGRAGKHLSVPGTHVGLVANTEVMRILGSHLGSERAPRAVRLGPRRRQRRASPARAGAQERVAVPSPA
jgi:pimeloyl-ACP methyl ester carboxylesterase